MNKIRLTTEEKNIISRCSDASYKILKKYNLKNGDKVCTKIEDDSYKWRDSIKRMPAQGRIIVSGEDPKNKPVIWFHGYFICDVGKELELLIPLYELTWFEKI